MKPMRQWKLGTDGVYKCLKCGKSYPYQVSIRKHIKVCGRIKPVTVTECSICGKSFMYPYLSWHLKSHKKKGDNLVSSFLISFSSTNGTVLSS